LSRIDIEPQYGCKAIYLMTALAGAGDAVAARPAAVVGVLDHPAGAVVVGGLEDLARVARRRDALAVQILVYLLVYVNKSIDHIRNFDFMCVPILRG
jgi:hypothetical protein